MIEKATGMKQWSKIPELMDIMGDNFSTDMRPSQVVDMAQALLVQKQRNMYSHTLAGTGGRLQTGGTWYYFVDEEDLTGVQTMIKNWLDADTLPSGLILPQSDQEQDKKEVQPLSSTG